MSDIIKIIETTDTVKIVPVAGSIGNGLTGGFEAGQTLAVSLTSSAASMSAKTALTGSFATLTGASLSLAAGTWIVTAQASIGATTLGSALAASGIFALRLFNGTTTIVSVHGGVARDATTTTAQLSSGCLSAIVTIASTTTISLQAVGTTTLSAYHQEQGSGTTQGSATYISAVRIA